MLQKTINHPSFLNYIYHFKREMICMLWIELQMVLSQHDHYRGDDDESAIVDTDVVTMSTAAGQSRVCVNINK